MAGILIVDQIQNSANTNLISNGVIAANTIGPSQLQTGTALSNIGTGGMDQSYLNATSQYMGFKNRFINGGFVVSQYNGTSSFTATPGGLRYGIDRFFMYCAGANLTGQQITGTNTGTYKAWKITGATGSTLLNFAQRIESLNTTDLANQTVTVSVKVYCSTAISGAQIYALVPTAQDNYASTTTSFSTGITLSAGLNTISVTGTIGSAGANGVEVGIAFGSGIGNGVTAEVGNFQLEKGPTATAFDYRPYGTELALCQRYCLVQSGGTFAYGTATGSTAAYRCRLNQVVALRSSPAITFSGGMTVAVPGIAGANLSGISTTYFQNGFAEMDVTTSATYGSSLGQTACIQGNGTFIANSEL